MVFIKISRPESSEMTLSGLFLLPTLSFTGTIAEDVDKCGVAVELDLVWCLDTLPYIPLYLSVSDTEYVLSKTTSFVVRVEETTLAYDLIPVISDSVASEGLWPYFERRVRQ